MPPRGGAPSRPSHRATIRIYRQPNFRTLLPKPSINDQQLLSPLIEDSPVSSSEGRFANDDAWTEPFIEPRGLDSALDSEIPLMPDAPPDPPISAGRGSGRNARIPDSWQFFSLNVREDLGEVEPEHDASVAWDPNNKGKQPIRVPTWAIASGSDPYIDQIQGISLSEPSYQGPNSNGWPNSDLAQAIRDSVSLSQKILLPNNGSPETPMIVLTESTSNFTSNRLGDEEDNEFDNVDCILDLDAPYSVVSIRFVEQWGLNRLPIPNKRAGLRRLYQTPVGPRNPIGSVKLKLKSRKHKIRPMTVDFLVADLSDRVEANKVDIFVGHLLYGWLLSRGAVLEGIALSDCRYGTNDSDETETPKPFEEASDQSLPEGTYGHLSSETIAHNVVGPSHTMQSGQNQNSGHFARPGSVFPGMSRQIIGHTASFTTGSEMQWECFTEPGADYFTDPTLFSASSADAFSSCGDIQDRNQPLPGWLAGASQPGPSRGMQSALGDTNWTGM